jgi:hypothetical protein
MKTLLSIIIIGLLMGCSPQNSKVTPSPSPSKIIMTGDADLPDEVISSWEQQKSFFIKENFQILDWEAAKALLRQKNYSGGKQYHTGWLTIYTNDGNKYLTKQPSIDVFFQFMKEENLNTEGFGTE